MKAIVLEVSMMTAGVITLLVGRHNVAGLVIGFGMLFAGWVIADLKQEVEYDSKG